MGDVIELDQRQFEHIGPHGWPGELVWARKSDGVPGIREAAYVGLFVRPTGHVSDVIGPRAWVRVMWRDLAGEVQMRNFALSETARAQILDGLDAVPASLFWRVCGVAAVSSLGLLAALIIGWLS